MSKDDFYDKFDQSYWDKVNKSKAQKKRQKNKSSEWSQFEDGYIGKWNLLQDWRGHGDFEGKTIGNPKKMDEFQRAKMQHHRLGLISGKKKFKSKPSPGK